MEDIAKKNLTSLMVFLNDTMVHKIIFGRDVLKAFNLGFVKLNENEES